MITFDNGGEFVKHHQWREVLELPSFFCDPYTSWQKRGVENTNGRLRRDMPRKSLSWLTPLEAFKKNLYRVAL